MQCYSAVVGPNGSGKSNGIDAMLFASFLDFEFLLGVSMWAGFSSSQKHGNCWLRFRLISSCALHNLENVICMCWCSVSQLWLGQMVVGRAMSLMLCSSSLASVPNRSFCFHLFKFFLLQKELKNIKTALLYFQEISVVRSCPGQYENI